MIVVSILFLVILEGLLSFDNALGLAALVRHLPDTQRKRALSYGIWGAFAFRLISIFCIQWILQIWWLRLAGGAYLLWLFVNHIAQIDGDPCECTDCVPAYSFWKTIALVELTDISLSLDSILASTAVSSKYWVVVTGGILGIVMMRFAAIGFIKLMELFPRLNDVAFALIGIVGLKLVLESAGLEVPQLVFWGLMAGSLAYGFSEKTTPPQAQKPLRPAST